MPFTLNITSIRNKTNETIKSQIIGLLRTAVFTKTFFQFPLVLRLDSYINHKEFKITHFCDLILFILSDTYFIMVKKT